MDLQTHYMGLKLKNPLIASASPLAADVGNIRHLEDAGAAAAAFKKVTQACSSCHKAHKKKK